MKYRINDFVKKVGITKPTLYKWIERGYLTKKKDEFSGVIVWTDKDVEIVENEIRPKMALNYTTNKRNDIPTKPTKS